MQHIASNTAPPGSTDTSRGTEGGVGTGAESGGVSSSETLQSRFVPGSTTEQTSSSSQGGVVETVKSYLGFGGVGSQAAETGQLGTTSERKNAEDDTTGSGSGAGITGVAATAASAVGLGSGNSAAGGGLGSTSSSSGAAANDTTGSSSSTTSAGGALEAAKEKVQQVTNTAGGDSKPVTSGDDEHKPPQAAGGKPHKLENPTSIPIAGGERLGEKHWGESKIVPDNPEPRGSEAGISSEAGSAGQPTRMSCCLSTPQLLQCVVEGVLTVPSQSKRPTTPRRTPVAQRVRLAVRATTPVATVKR